MAAEPAEGVTHIAKGAEDVEARGTDEISARLRSFDLRRHRTRERTLTSGFVAACVITALVLLGAFYASTHRGSPAVQPVLDSSDASVEAVAANLQGALTAPGSSSSADEQLPTNVLARA
jgi:cytoskeletal protein RodZ